MTQAQTRTLQLPDTVTRFSEIGTPHEKMKWWAPLGWLMVFVFSMFIILFLLALSPLILLEILIMGWYKKRYKYHRNPADIKIAIIGAGWGGMQAMERFKKIGVTNVDIFEKHDDIGGTWHKDLRYHGVQIHGSMTVTSFDNLPYSADPDVQGGKVLGEEVERYIHRFADNNQLKEHCRFNTHVDGVNYDSESRKGTLSLTDTVSGEKREEGPYDLVIWASMAAYPNMPDIAGSGVFKGQQYHSSAYKAEQLDDIIKNNKKVLVIGGGKAGCDIVLNLKRSGYDNFEWYMRKPYLFYRFETLLHNGSLKHKIMGVSYLCTVLWSAVSKKLSAILHWASDYVTTFGKPHTDFNHFHGGVLCPTQRQDLAHIAHNIGEIASFKENSVILKDGREIACDVVIWATGNRSGIETLALSIDNKPFHLKHDAKLYNHFIVPQMPVLASSTALWTAFGPMRATNSAELAVFHLCVRRPRTEKHMQKAANRQLSTNSIKNSFIWAQNACWLQQWVYFHMDLMFAGLTPFESFMKHALEVFVMSKETPLEFHILPKTVPA